MKPEIEKASQIAPNQSVICILGSNDIPENLLLSKTETEFAKKKLSEKEEFIFINSYYKCTYLVRIKDGIPDFKYREELRKSAFNLKKLIKSNNHQEVVITSSDAPDGVIQAFTEGLILSFYSFRKYKTKEDDNDKNNYPERLLLYGIIGDADLQWLIVLCEAVYLTRDMINEPPNRLNAAALAEEIRRMGNVSGFNVEVFNKGKIETLKMGGLLAVNRGSVDPPVFCILEWNPKNKLNEKPIVLVGKGIIYDTGGLNIKTGDYMALMKADMAGAATVAGVLYTAAKTSIPLHIIGLIPATDNRPGENAYTQGDILTMHNNTTVEICNTDAEGRLILADAISYAGNYSPELIVDIATLTGSAAMTFGNQAIAVMGNAERKYFSLLEDCANEVYERVAELPFWEEYGEMIKSDVADVKNVGGREGGAITAGKFLESFTKFPFLHLDIAGTGMLKRDDFYRTKTGPGSGLRLLATFVKKLATLYK